MNKNKEEEEEILSIIQGSIKGKKREEFMEEPLSFGDLRDKAKKDKEIENTVDSLFTPKA